jgi:hypothetical protein
MPNKKRFTVLLFHPQTAAFLSKEKQNAIKHVFKTVYSTAGSAITHVCADHQKLDESNLTEEQVRQLLEEVFDMYNDMLTEMAADVLLENYGFKSIIVAPEDNEHSSIVIAYAGLSGVSDNQIIKETLKTMNTNIVMVGEPDAVSH